MLATSSTQDFSETSISRVGHWTTCPKCGRPTAITALFCMHQSTLIAFQPKWWLTAAFILVPTAAGLLLSVWPSHTLIYLLLSFAIFLYLAVAFRSLGNTRPVVLLWSVVAFVFLGAQDMFPAGTVVANLGVFAYLIVFGILILRRALKYVDFGHHEIAVAISATSALVTLYSLSLEFVKLVKFFGLGTLWLSDLYSEWLFWIMLVRVTLIAGSLIILAVKASSEVSVAGGGTESTCSNLLEHFAYQFKQWADLTFAGAKIFWRLLKQSMHIVTRLAIRFGVEELLPAFIILAAAAATVRLSIDLVAYITARGSSALALGALVPTIIGAVFLFGYLELIAGSSSVDLDWPHLTRGLRPYWYGAVTDTRMLVFYISYVIPLTTALLFGVHWSAAHFHYATVFPGFGFYFSGFSCLFVIAFTWGYLRNRDLHMSRRLVQDDSGRAAIDTALQKPMIRVKGDQSIKRFK
jgi:hypothetical protein